MKMQATMKEQLVAKNYFYLLIQNKFERANTTDMIRFVRSSIEYRGNKIEQKN